MAVRAIVLSKSTTEHSILGVYIDPFSVSLDAGYGDLNLADGHSGIPT